MAQMVQTAHRARRQVPADIVRFPLLLTREMRRRLKTAAAAEAATMQDVVRRLINEYLEHGRKGAAA